MRKKANLVAVLQRAILPDGGRDMQTNQAKATEDRLLTVREVAEMLGVSVRLVNRLFATGELPRVKIGRAARARLSDVERIIAEGVK